LPETATSVFNLDALLPIGAPELERIANEMMEMISQFCGGRMECTLLKKDRPQISMHAGQWQKMIRANR